MQEVVAQTTGEKERMAWLRSEDALPTLPEYSFFSAQPITVAMDPFPYLPSKIQLHVILC